MEQATTVSPIPSEEEMNTINAIFQRASNAIVDASRLAQEVSDLRKQVEALKMDIEHVREQNRWLDEQLHDLRSKRDELQRAHNDLHSQHISLGHEHAALQDKHAGLEATLEQTRRHRDDAEFKVLDLEEKNKGLQATVEELRSKLDQISALVGQVQQVSAVIHTFPQSGTGGGDGGTPSEPEAVGPPVIAAGSW